MKINKWVIGFCLLLCITTLYSCAPSGYATPKAGFLYGIWHGFIIIFSIIGKIIGQDVGIYAENNTGLFYWIGFIIGIGGLGGGGSAARR